MTMIAAAAPAASSATTMTMIVMALPDRPAEALAVPVSGAVDGMAGAATGGASSG